MRINDKRETPYHCRLMGYNGKEAKEKKQRRRNDGEKTLKATGQKTHKTIFMVN